MCAVCGKPPTEQRLSVDHSHETGEVRGLLCNNCNSGIGRFKDNPETLVAAAVYLMKRSGYDIATSLHRVQP